MAAEVVGFSTAWTTMAPFPADRCYPEAAAGLGPERTAQWLCGALEVDELAVRTAARGTGVAAELLKTVTTDAPEGGGIAVFLRPRHPARILAAAPLDHPDLRVHPQGRGPAHHPVKARGETGP